MVSKRFIEDDTGAALIEMTVVAPFLIILAMGAMAFGQILIDYGTLNKSVRDAARYVSRVPVGAVCSWGLSNAQNLATYGQESAGTTPLMTGMTSSMVTMITPDCSATPSGSFNIEIQAAVPYTNTALAAVGLVDTFTMTVTHEEPYVGR